MIKWLKELFGGSAAKAGARVIKCLWEFCLWECIYCWGWCDQMIMVSLFGGSVVIGGAGVIN